MQPVKRDQALDAVTDQKLVPQQIDIIRFKIKAKRAFAAHDRLPFGVLKCVAKQLQPVPGIFTKEPDAGIEMHRAHKFNHIKPGAVHAFQNGTHHCSCHAGSPQALVAVPQSGIDDLYTAHRLI